MTTTIVTGYFQLNKSKANHYKYVEWMSNMLAIQRPMVIFCDEQSFMNIYELRKKYINITRIIITYWTDFYCYRYVEHFQQHLQLDSELKKGHSAELYMVWSEKSNFLKRAAEINPFSTDFFLWVDIGCFRKPNTEFLQWPNAEKINLLPRDKMLLLSIIPFTPDELNVSELCDLPSFQHTDRIGAPIFGGFKDTILNWHQKYYEMLEYFISIGRFIGKDQSIMNSVYLIHRHLCFLVYWNRSVCKTEQDIWFYLQRHLK
jgi:Bacterial protein of unknown function (HtrL_YibB)